MDARFHLCRKGRQRLTLLCVISLGQIHRLKVLFLIAHTKSETAILQVKAWHSMAVSKRPKCITQVRLGHLTV